MGGDDGGKSGVLPLRIRFAGGGANCSEPGAAPGTGIFVATPSCPPFPMEVPAPTSPLLAPPLTEAAPSLAADLPAAALPATAVPLEEEALDGITPTLMPHGSAEDSRTSMWLHSHTVSLS